MIEDLGGGYVKRTKVSEFFTKIKKNPFFKEVIDFAKYFRVSFSQHDIYIFLYVFLIRVLGSDNLKSFEADKGIEFLPPTTSEKNRSSKGQIFRPVPQLAHLSTCTFPNLHIPQLELFAIFVCSIENLSPPTAGTLFVFILCDIADSRKVVLIEHFF